MKYLRRTTAIAAALSCFAFAANAQNNDQSGETASNTQAGAQASYCDKPWSKVDGNSDGTVSKQEASTAIENQFGQIDSDGNGEITKVEWITCMGSIDQQAAAEADRDKQNFAEADTDKDTKINREEFRKKRRAGFPGH
ncbi:EF-hand domain-containing protein [Roseibium salinum]|nr:EF-hand domain-containing protein [Roseibium salinum]